MSISIIPHPSQRVLRIPVWHQKPRPPTLIIAAVVQEGVVTGPVTTQSETLVYPGEGFDVVLPACMDQRVTRQREIRTWQVTRERLIQMAGVNLADPAGPRSMVTMAQGNKTESWQEIYLSPVSLVPPLDEQGAIPDCGSYSQQGSITTRMLASQDQRPVLAELGDAAWRQEAERVRDEWPWQNYDVDRTPTGTFKVRAVPLSAEVLADFVYPDNPGQRHSGPCTLDAHFQWQPPTPTPVADTPWRNEANAWLTELDWWQVAEQHWPWAHGRLRTWGDLSLRSETAPDRPPCWQVVVTWQGRPGSLQALGQEQAALCWTNQAASRLVSITRQPDGGWQETRQLLHISHHPVTGTLTETPVLTGTRTVAGDTQTYAPHWKVEAYQEEIPAS